MADPRHRATVVAVLATPYVRGWAVDAMAAWLVAFAVADAVAAVTALDVVPLDGGAGRAVVALVGMLYLLPLLRHRRGRINRR